RLGLSETNPLLTANHGKQEAVFLLFVAVTQNWTYLRAEERRIAKGYRHPTRDFFHDHAPAHQIEAGTAIFLRYIEQPQTDRLAFFLQRLGVLVGPVFRPGPALA